MKSADAEQEKPKRSILVVDDEEGIRDLFVSAFRQDNVRTCGSAEEAFEVLKDEKFDVMILDIRLPGMNGCELCMDIRKNHPHAFIIGMTGFANKFEFAQCRKAGFDAYFYKPVSMITLKQLVARHFGDEWIAPGTGR